MKKIQAIVLSLCLLLSSLFTSGCNTASYPITKLKGTYELTAYTRSYSDGANKEIKEVDQMENGLKAYLIVTGGAYGYYVDNTRSANQDAKVSKIRLYYKMDTDGLKCTSIEYRHKDQGTTICSLRLDDGKLSEKITAGYGIFTELSQDGYMREWKKVSNDADFTYVKTQFEGEIKIPR